MDQEKSENQVKNEMEKIAYPGFMARTGAYLLNALFFIPYFLIVFYFQRRWNQDENFFLLSVILQIFNSIFSTFITIFFNKKYGGNPGKLICKYKIVREDGLPLTWATAVKRELIAIIIVSLNLIFFYTCYFTHSGLFNTFSEASLFYSRTRFQRIFSNVTLIVYMYDYGRVKFSSKKQALHDKIAGTLVVRKSA